MKRTQHLMAIGVLVVMLTGCAVMEQEEVGTTMAPGVTIKVKSGAEELESEEEAKRQLYLQQTSKYYLMTGQIGYKNKKYYLRISKKEAAFLGIPEDLYCFYEEYVNKLNSR